MKISTEKIKNDKVILNHSISLPYTYLINSKINKVKCDVTGSIDKQFNGSLSVIGKIYSDDIYPFELDIQENFEKYVKKDKKSLDISLIIWENIVLEVLGNVLSNFENLYKENS